jgi:mono/diheme cytochrome c family protein
MKYIPFHLKRGLAIVAVVALTACGGGEGGGVITTTVMDGLIKNAVVCVDTNNNNVCDLGETQGRTDVTGKVTLKLTSAEMGTARLVARVGTDALDQDTGVNVPTAYTLQTPAGKYDVISPLTTMVQAKMDADTVDVNAAESYVIAQTGLPTTISAFDDFIAKRGSSSNHKNAGVMARLMVVSAEHSMETAESCDSNANPPTETEKHHHIRRNLLDKLVDVSSNAGTINGMSCATGNFTTACATAVAGMAPVVSHCTSPVAQTITFAMPANKIVGVPATLAATASSGLPVTFTSNSLAVCTVSGSALTLLTPGSCAITASQAGDSSYSAATAVSRSFTVTATPPPTPLITQTISFSAPASLTIGTPVTLSATGGASGQPVVLAASPTAVCTLSGSTLTPVATGTCTVTASQAGSSTYAAATTVSQPIAVSTVPVTPSAQTITFAGPASQTMGIAAPALAATSTSGLTVAFASTTGTVCTVSGTTLTLVAAGSCTITASQAGNTGYTAATPVSRTVTVSAAVTGGTAAAAGKLVYTANSCAACHGAPPSSNKVLNGANSASKITNAINGNTGGMGMYRGVITAQQISDLAAYLATPNI